MRGGLASGANGADHLSRIRRRIIICMLRQNLHFGFDFIKQCGHGRTIVAQGLAKYQIICLNGRRSFIDWQNARIAEMLCGAGFLDKPHAAMHLHRLRGHIKRAFGHPAFDNRD